MPKPTIEWGVMPYRTLHEPTATLLADENAAIDYAAHPASMTTPVTRKVITVDGERYASDWKRYLHHLRDWTHDPYTDIDGTEVDDPKRVTCPRCRPAEEQR